MEILLAPLRSREAVLSSRIGGTILYQRAFKNAQYAIAEGYPFFLNFIKQIHQQLLYFGRGAKKSPGEFKKEQNYLADKEKLLSLSPCVQKT